MKIRWLQAGLILSLAFNMGFLGAFVYVQIQKRDAANAYSEPRVIHLKTDSTSHADHLIWMEIDPDQKTRIRKSRLHFEPKVHKIKMKLHEEKTKLSELLVKDPVDTILIDEKIETIGRLQAEIEKEVVYQLLKEKAELGPEQSHRFLKVVTEKLQDGGPHQAGPQKIIIKKEFRDASGKLNETIEINEEIQKE